MSIGSLHSVHEHVASARIVINNVNLVIKHVLGSTPPACWKVMDDYIVSEKTYEILEIMFPYSIRSPL